MIVMHTIKIVIPNLAGYVSNNWILNTTDLFKEKNL